MNNSKEIRDLLVEKYFNGTLSPTEGKELESQILSDKAFAEVFALEKVIRSQKNSPSEQAREEFLSNYKKGKKLRRLLPWLALLVCVSIFYTYKFYSKEKPAPTLDQTEIPKEIENSQPLPITPPIEISPDQTIENKKKESSQNSAPDSKSQPMASLDLKELDRFIVPTKRRSTVKSNSASVHYDLKDYEKFILAIDPEIQKAQGSQKRDLILMLGSANLILGNYNDAITIFQRLLQDESAKRYHLEATYNMAIAYLKSNEISKGKRLLETIKRSRKQAEVEAILTLIE